MTLPKGSNRTRVCLRASFSAQDSELNIQGFALQLRSEIGALGADGDRKEKNRNVYLGGCQNYGPFLAPFYNTAPNI